MLEILILSFISGAARAALQPDHQSGVTPLRRHVHRAIPGLYEERLSAMCRFYTDENALSRALFEALS